VDWVIASMCLSPRVRALPWALCLLLSAAEAAMPGLTGEEVRQLRLDAVNLINADRATFGLAAVELDDRATKVGDLFCEAALAQDIRGHFLTDGLSPFLRYAFWGNGTDYTGQNACSTFGMTRAEWDYESVLEVLRRYQVMMMSERPPADWHRRNILNPWHTHVGIGLAWGPTGVRMSQDFVNRYVAVNEIATDQPLDATPLFAGRILKPERFELAGITVFFEDPPRELSVADANARMSYSPPAECRHLRVQLPPGQFYTDTRSRGDVVVREDGTFGCRLRFWQGRPGIYGVAVRLRPIGTTGVDDQFYTTYVCLRVYPPRGEDRADGPRSPLALPGQS